MKKPLFVVLILSLALSACSFISQTPVATNSTGEAPQVNIQETAAMMAGTMAAQTIAALPTPTVVTPSKVVAVSPTATGSATINQNIMAPTMTVTLSATATTVTETPTITPVNTATQTQTPVPGNGLVTPTVTSPLTYYGTLPPNLPYGFLTLSNKSKVEANISLQCTTTDGYTTILEYSGIKGVFDIHAPAGKYEYVAWVGGKQMMGKFSLGKRQELLITLYKDKVVIR